MRIHYQQLQAPFPKHPVVTVGTFDGVHLGHQTILKRLAESAHQQQGETVVITFDPHPRSVLRPDDDSLRILQSIEEKAERLELLGIDHLLILQFTLKFASMDYNAFVEEILVKTVGTKHLVVGYDHQFGRNREGSFSNLRQLGGQLGFTVEEIPAHEVDAVTISSTRIRNALLSGDVKTASLFLGYPYNLRGNVVKGNQIGRTIGFPTANLEIPGELKLIPADGVYAVTVTHNNVVYAGMLNIGIRPTVTNMQQRVVEVHLLDYEGSLYAETIDVGFVERIRDEQKFDGIDALIVQLKQDKAMVNRILNL